MHANFDATEHLLLNYVTQYHKPYLQLIWNPNTSFLSDELYRSCVKEYAHWVSVYNASRVLIDTRYFLHSIRPTTQDWINLEIFPKNVHAGLQYMAIIVGTNDLFAQMTIHQTMSDDNIGFFVRYFDDEQKAVEWLIAS